MKQVYNNPSLLEQPDKKSEIENKLDNLDMVAERLESIQDIPQEYRELDNKVDNIIKNNHYPEKMKPKFSFILKNKTDAFHSLD